MDKVVLLESLVESLVDTLVDTLVTLRMATHLHLTPPLPALGLVWNLHLHAHGICIRG